MAAIPSSNESPYRRALRLALGVTAAFALAQLANWPLAHLAPVFAVILLQDASPMPFRDGWKLFQTAAFFFCIGGLVTFFLSPWPIVLVFTSGFLLYRAYLYMMMSGAHPLAVISVIIGFVLMPVLVVLFPALGLIAGIGILADIGVGIIIAWVAWLVMPMSSPPPKDHHSGPLNYDVASPMAATLAIVMMPLMALYLSYGWTQVLVLVYSVLFATAYSSNRVRGLGVTYIIANGVYGGLGMLICYELFVMVPNIAFMIVVVLLAVYIFANRIFWGGSTGAFWGSGLFGFLIMLGGILMKDEVVTTGTLVDRVWQISLATAYITFSFSVIEMFKDWGRRVNS